VGLLASGVKVGVGAEDANSAAQPARSNETKNARTRRNRFEFIFASILRLERKGDFATIHCPFAIGKVPDRNKYLSQQSLPPYMKNSGLKHK
jgi:hypothetical protein